MAPSAKLAIDASSSPARAGLVIHNDGAATFVARGIIECSSPVVSFPRANNEGDPRSSPQEGSLPFFNLKQLSDFIQSVDNQWSNSLLIVPPYNCFSLTIAIPVRDRKSLNRMIELEVQDTVAFDTDEFFLTHTLLKRSPSGLTQIHVAGIPKEFLKQVLAECKSVGFEPVAVTTPSAVLNGFHGLADESEDQSSAIAYSSDDLSALLVRANGSPYMEKMFFHSSFDDDVDLSRFCLEASLALIACERQLETPINRLYAIGSPRLHTSLQKSAGLSREVLSIAHGGTSEEKAWCLVRLAALCLQEDNPQPLLTNFRAREFAYSPQLRELGRGLRAFLPYLLGALLITLLSLVLIFSIRSYRAHSLENALQREVKRVAPALLSPQGQELEALQGETRRLDDELKELGSPTTISPIDALLELSKDIPQVPAISIRRVRVQGTRVFIEGNAPDYSAVEQLEKVLKRRREVYCRFKKDASQGGFTQGDKRNFNFELILCE